VTEKPWRVVHVLDLRGVDYVQQVQRVSELAQDYEKAKVVVDMTNESVLVELLKKAGTWAEGVRFTAEAKAELVIGLQLLFERKELVLLPQHRDLLQELRFYQARVTKSGHVKYGAPEGGKMHDDLVTALALAVRGAGAPAEARSWAAANLPPFIIGSSPYGLGLEDGFPRGSWGPWSR
jgi:Terminase RNaseH-like domain